MKILYLHQYFKTPAEPGGTRSYWIAQELISQGHEVNMISANQNISKRKEIRNINGIRVIYLRVPYNNSMGVFRRLFSFIHFMLGATWVALWQKNIDVAIATSTPLTIGFPALVIRFFKRVPFLFEVRDLWPEVPIQIGVLKNPIIKKLAIGFEHLIYKKAKHIVALSPGMKYGVLNSGIPSEKVSVIPNMAKIDKFWPRNINNKIFEKYKLNKNSFKVVHFGAMGLANGLKYIIDTAVILKSKNITEIDFLFVGEGAVKSQLETIAIEEKLSSVHFLGAHPMKETSEIVNVCDVSIVTFLNLSILATNSPNKLFDSLSAGKPIVVNSNGWTREMAEKYNVGFYVDPENPNELAELLAIIKSQKIELTEIGKNARKLAETKYDKSILCKEFAEVLNTKF